jgi:hypothetical protein
MVPIAEIAARLDERAGELAAELLPGGRRDRGQWRCGSIFGDPGDSFVYTLAGQHRGRWHEFSDGSHGDTLDLVAAVRFGGSKSDAIRWARRYLGIDDADPAALRQQAMVRAERQAQEAQQHAEHDQARRRRAKARWLAGTPIEGTAADAYLAGRGIGLAQLGRAPRALRFTMREWNQEANAELPAMLAAIVAADGTHLATHRTYLEPDHAGGWRKASLRHSKMTLGGYVGGTINLWRGKSGRPLRQAPDGDVVALAEGIEDALTVALACPDWRVLAAVSVANLASVTLPPTVAEVVLVLQRDGENDQVKLARNRAERRFMEEGRSVRRALPPEGFKDFNDWWRATRGQVAA